MLVAILVAACADKTSSPQATAATVLDAEPQVRTLHARCVEAMVRSACVASKDTATSSATPASSVVMLAGIGAVDAHFYAKLRAAGDSMCEVLIQPCQKNWDGAQCMTARALWSTL
jgi:hypothetical protein